MIILKLMGGLGNQMSQIAYALAISKMYEEPVYLDTSSYNEYKIRPFSIDKLKLSDRFIISDNRVPNINRMHLLQRIYESLHYHIGSKKPLGKKIYKLFVVFGHYYSFDPLFYGIPRTYRRSKDIYGYFLSEGYFRENRMELMELFDTQEKYLTTQCFTYSKMIEESLCPVAISIRLQDDYVKSKINNVCTKEYYLKALNLIKEKYPEADFFVFADDIERAKSLKMNIDAVYMEKISDVEGMYLLKRCKHYIISNSSFAWWGAYLGKHPEKTVIAPKCWMNDGKDYSSKYYKEMIAIDF